MGGHSHYCFKPRVRRLLEINQFQPRSHSETCPEVQNLSYQASGSNPWGSRGRWCVPGCAPPASHHPLSPRRGGLDSPHSLAATQGRVGSPVSHPPLLASPGAGQSLESPSTTAGPGVGCPPLPRTWKTLSPAAGVRGDVLRNTGPGPTVYQLLSACEAFRKIIASDHLQQNPQEVKKWLKKEPGAYDWSPAMQ